MFDFTPDFEETLSTDEVNITTHGPTCKGSMAHLGQGELFGLISKDSATLNLIEYASCPNNVNIADQHSDRQPRQSRAKQCCISTGEVCSPTTKVQESRDD